MYLLIVSFFGVYLLHRSIVALRANRSTGALLALVGSLGCIALIFVSAYNFDATQIRVP